RIETKAAEIRWRTAAWERHGFGTVPGTDWPKGASLFRTRDSRLRVDDDVGDVWARAADQLLELARARMGICERRRRVEADGQVDEQAVASPQQAKLARRRARRIANDTRHCVLVSAIRVVSLRLLGQRLEMRPDGVDLRHALDDRALDCG